MPRIKGRQSHRDNATSNDPEEYYKPNIPILFCDFLNNEMYFRFAEEDRIVLLLLLLLLKHYMTDINEAVK
jgi:hypothetical protein